MGHGESRSSDRSKKISDGILRRTGKWVNEVKIDEFFFRGDHFAVNVCLLSPTRIISFAHS